MAAFVVPAAMFTAIRTGLSRFGMSGIFNSLRGRMSWSALPAIVKRILIGLGVTEGVDVIFPGSLTPIPNPELNPPLLPSINYPGAENAGMMGGIAIVGRWTANGIQFVKLSDGRHGAQRKNGTWKFWRPKRPLVLYASGASDLKTLLKADTAVTKQLKNLEKAINKRKPRQRRPRQGSAERPIIIESGPGSVHHS